MENILLFCTILTGLLFAPNKQEEPLSGVIERGLNVSRQQTLLLAKEMEAKENRLPKTYENGVLQTANYKSWISGFFPGVLWYLYEDTPTEELKKYAELYTLRVMPAKDMTSTHDLGFMLYCSFGNGYRLTGNKSYMDVMKVGAESLASRYNDKVGAIKSWNSNKKWQFPVIIDNMMNLEFLSFMALNTGNNRFKEIAACKNNS